MIGQPVALSIVCQINETTETMLSYSLNNIGNRDIKLNCRNFHVYIYFFTDEYVLNDMEFYHECSECRIYEFKWSNPRTSCGWVNNRKAGDLKCHHNHYDVTVMIHHDSQQRLTDHFLIYHEYETINFENPCNVESPCQNVPYSNSTMTRKRP